MKNFKYDFETIAHLRTETKEYHSCFACNQLFPVKRMEQHHFPIPTRYGGEQTIWLCLACHDFVDRITIAKWPEHFVENAINAGREHKLLLLKLWSVYTDLKFGNDVTKEAARIRNALTPKINTDKYGFPICKECGEGLKQDQLSKDETSDWYCDSCLVDESDFKKYPHDLSLSHTQLWMLANIWLSIPKNQKLNFCMKYRVDDIVESEMDAKAKAILAVTQQ